MDGSRVGCTVCCVVASGAFRLRLGLEEPGVLAGVDLGLFGIGRLYHNTSVVPTLVAMNASGISAAIR